MRTITCTLMLLSAAFSFSQGGWTKVTDGNPVTTFVSAGTFKGAAWIDVNNDGNVDLYAVPDFIFLNNGSGSFTQLSGLNINADPLQLGGCSWGDINNDGNIDFITAQNPSEVYLNNGNNTFQNITNTIPALEGYASWGAVLGDVNEDNRLDMVFAHALGYHGEATSYPCRFFTQTADGTFTQITGYNFTDDLKTYTVPSFNDYDQDGDMDLFIASGPGGLSGPDFCYKNMKIETGNDELVQMTVEPWMTTLQDGQCYNFIDYDNDGDFDCCLTNYAGAPTRFYKNNDGTYQAIGTPFNSTGAKLSNDWGDFDNDGDLDVIIARNVSSLIYYKNNGNGTFSTQATSITVPTGSSCVVNCDYDNDGDLDVFVNGLDDARSLWRNDNVAEGRNWVNYTLKGVVSNTSAIGAIVKLKSVINGVPTWQTRQVNAQNSFQGENDLRVHFGLNDSPVIDSLKIYWPSGIKEFYINKSVNQFETLVEGNGTSLSVTENRALDNITVTPNPATEYVSIIFNDRTPSNAILKIADLTGKIIYNQNLRDRETKIPVMQFKAGSYIILITDGKPLAAKKIIINHNP